MAKNDKTLVKKTIYNKVVKKVIYEMCECCDEILNGKYFARHECGCKLLCEKCIKRHDAECEGWKENKV